MKWHLLCQTFLSLVALRTDGVSRSSCKNPPAAWVPKWPSRRDHSGGKVTCRRERTNYSGPAALSNLPWGITAFSSPMANTFSSGAENPPMLTPLEPWHWTDPSGGCRDTEPHSNINIVVPWPDKPRQVLALATTESVYWPQRRPGIFVFLAIPKGKPKWTSKKVQ